MKKNAKTLAQTKHVAKNTYTPHPMDVYMLGSALVTTYVHSQTLMAANGCWFRQLITLSWFASMYLTPDIDLKEEGKISAEMIHGRPFAPILQNAPNIMIIAVAPFPPATVDADCDTPDFGCASAMYTAR